MGVPLLQKASIAKYVAAQKLRGNQRFPLVLMLEPLFRCNLSCLGCGKTAYAEEILDRRLTPQECFDAADECGAPVVSIAGGEPLLHGNMPEIAAGLIARKKFVYLCTNGLLLKKRLADYAPSPYFAFSVHADGNREVHDRLTDRPGMFDLVMNVLKTLGERGFQFVVNCTIYNGHRPEEIADFFDRVLDLGARGITVSPGFGHPGDSEESLFLRRDQSMRFFRCIFKLGRGRKWQFNQSSLFLDFLTGNQDYLCTPWGNVTRNVLGWQRPCYLLAEGYAPSFEALMQHTDWRAYGPGRHSRCAHCMLHSGFEATAVNDTFAHPLKALAAYWRGPSTEGPFAAVPGGISE